MLQDPTNSCMNTVHISFVIDTALRTYGQGFVNPSTPATRAGDLAAVARLSLMLGL